VTPLLHTSFLALDAKGGVKLSIYVLVEQWTCIYIWIWNLACNNSKFRLCETMWAWDIWLCACDAFLCFLSAKDSLC
jgi:hypothetical protein